MKNAPQIYQTLLIVPPRPQRLRNPRKIPDIIISYPYQLWDPCFERGKQMFFCIPTPRNQPIIDPSSSQAAQHTP